MVNQSIIDTVKLYIQKIPDNMEIKKAYLFGSYAKGCEHKDSDIDIAIVIGKMDDFFAVQMQLMRLRRTIDLRIENAKAKPKIIFSCVTCFLFFSSGRIVCKNLFYSVIDVFFPFLSAGIL
jgi:predicted nucleotidyltransferase